MAKLRATWRMSVLLVLLVMGLITELVFFPILSVRGREDCIRRWSRAILWGCGAKLQVQGLPPSQACLLAANHASWLDILIINSVQASQFVAKVEIRAWPVVGLLVARAGTHFIERAKRRAVHTVLQSLVRAMGEGRVIAVFPEGTTNDGKCLRPFHANFIQAALEAKVSVKPLGIRYENLDGSLSSAIEYVGDTTFVASIWRVLQLPALVAKLNWGANLEPVGTRHVLCEQVEIAISQLCGLPVAKRSISNSTA